MIFPDFQITQNECNSFVFKDTTPKYSNENLGGYGGLNPNAEEVTKTIVTLDFGKGQAYELISSYNQTKPDWIIHAGDIPINTASNSDCNDCGPVPCGCEDCDDSPKLEADCHGFLTGFPSGCIIVRQEIFVWDPLTSRDKSIGLKVKQIVSVCAQERKFIEIAHKLTLPNECGAYDFFKSEEKRLQTMREFSLAWTKLSLLQTHSPHCGCDCIASSIRQIDNFLDSIKP
ncbi:hypothetical protein [Dyadobacter sp. CY312]|uniref:hypothetical protein n=1 Tax=Dyadobacter sp. CY312 TaxID=2907303 RepID=UPI001F3F5406|nr:hypothetical protein [Dyadobacter sp. CY312]MCE7039246.1 hypothetical protein [Dyadobacter sp. CY312]